MSQGGPDALVLRPVASFVPVVTIAFGLAAAFCVIVAIASFLSQRPLGLLWAAPAIGCLYLIGEFRKTRLWADADSVGYDAPFQRARCARTELAGIRVGKPMGRSGALCEFVRTNGSVAFRTSLSDWGRVRLAVFARNLEVPFDDPALAAGHTCPVCGYPDLEEPVRISGGDQPGVGSHEICPSCGFEFGSAGDLGEPSYDAWREQWVAGGMSWWAAAAGKPQPVPWDPQRQVDRLTRPAS